MTGTARPVFIAHVGAAYTIADTAMGAAQVLNRGESVVNVESSILADGVLIGRASGSYAVFHPRTTRTAHDSIG